MKLFPFVLPPLENNNYLLIDEVSKEAALIDCSHYSQKVLDVLATEGVELKYILLTHAHFDHILGVQDMVKATGAKVLLHTDDLALLKKLNSYTMMVGLPDAEIPTVNEFIQDGAILRLGEQEIKVLHTPGHTEGGCSIFVQNMLFSGDTLFQESIGRTDLEGGDFSTLKNSIETKIYTLPEDTKVYPGHGPSTSIEHEKKFNSYI